ncbi:MAG: hypothetical protein L6R41_005849 [Letrouitia leprolyta]|nr:MAG: hypothetical protein L6R41_005849 [Letrouitia leprolyta]
MATYFHPSVVDRKEIMINNVPYCYVLAPIETPKEQTYVQKIVRLVHEKSKLANEYMALHASKRIVEIQNAELQKEDAELQRKLAGEIKEKEYYAKELAITGMALNGAEGREERLLEAAKENEKKAKSLKMSMREQERRINELEQQVTITKQDRETETKIQNEKFRRYRNASKRERATFEKKTVESQTKIEEYQAKVKELETEIEDRERDAEEMGQQLATDYLEKEKLKKSVKEQENRAGAAEKRVDDLVVTNTQLQQKLSGQAQELNALQAKQSSIGVGTARADAAELRITTLEAAKSELEGRLAAAEAKIARFEEEQKSESDYQDCLE